MKRKKRDWEKEVERMRQEFLFLYPSDRVWGSDEMLHDPLVAKRRGSTDILDPKKMKTLFLDYPDTGRKYRLRFKRCWLIKESIRVSTDGDRIVVRANSQEVSENGGTTVERMFERKIQKPKEVDHTKFKSYLTSDLNSYCWGTGKWVESPRPEKSHSESIPSFHVWSRPCLAQISVAFEQSRARYTV